MVGDTVKDGSHGVFTNTKVHILSRVRLVKTCTPISAVVDVVTARSVQISGSRHVMGDQFGNVLDNFVSAYTGGLRASLKLRNLRKHFFCAHHIVVNSIIKLFRKLRVSLLPRRESGLPFVVRSLVLCLHILEERSRVLRYIPLLTLRDANVHLSLVNVRNTGFSVGSVSSLRLFHTLTNDGVTFDQFGFAIVVGFGSGNGFLNGIKVMTVNIKHFPTIRFVPFQNILRLSVFRHLVKSHFIRIVKNDQVVKFLVSSEAGGLSTHTLLEATVTSKSVNVVVKNLVIFSIVYTSGHFLRSGETNRVSDTLSQRTGGTFNSWSVVLTVRELRVTRSHGMVLTEVHQLFHRQIVTGKVQPRVKKHRSVTGRKDKTVTVDPLWVLGIITHLRSVQNSADLSSTKGETHMTRVSGGNGIHCQTTSLVGSS
mmetsp:Transcript_48947/g.59214  ORF Transcript_48947/g.59214 Transcript_48947/m.59214 type:complete len:425 (+) Transcript_48947:836-2110(+)